jgi:hypothetical protein
MLNVDRWNLNGEVSTADRMWIVVFWLVAPCNREGGCNAPTLTELLFMT